MGIAREKGDFPYSKGARALSGQGVPGGGERGQFKAWGCRYSCAEAAWKSSQNRLSPCL